MNRSGFDQLTKDIGDALSRRTALRGATFGALALGLGLTGNLQASAKKKKSRKRSQKKGDVNKLCKGQVNQCLGLLSIACAGDEACLAVLDECCPSLGSCDLGGFFACAAANQP